MNFHHPAFRHHPQWFVIHLACDVEFDRGSLKKFAWIAHHWRNMLVQFLNAFVVSWRRHFAAIKSQMQGKHKLLTTQLKHFARTHTHIAFQNKHHQTASVRSKIKLFGPRHIEILVWTNPIAGVTIRWKSPWREPYSFTWVSRSKYQKDFPGKRGT